MSDSLFHDYPIIVEHVRNDQLRVNEALYEDNDLKRAPSSVVTNIPSC